MPEKQPFYIPGVPENLQGILYTPNHGQAETKRLRQQHAGNPAMQQRLMVDDRYHQGREMMQESPLAALAALGGSVPYDLAKLAYFNSPKPVQQLIEQGTERLFPGEGFNQQTTARPSHRGTGALMHGMAEGAYGLLRDQLEALNRKTFSDGTVARVREFTHRQNYGPSLAHSLVEDRVEDGRAIDTSTPEKARESIKTWATKQATIHALDPIGTSLKLLSTALQTANGDFDTRLQFEDWVKPEALFLNAAAPGLKPLKPMSPEAKAKQNAQISQILKSWGTAEPGTWPIRQTVEVPK